MASGQQRVYIKFGWTIKSSAVVRNSTLVPGGTSNFGHLFLTSTKQKNQQRSGGRNTNSKPSVSPGTLGVIYSYYIMELSFDNIVKFSSTLDTNTINQFFVDADGKTPTQEHADQIFVFKNEAAKFLWDFEHKVSNLEATEKFYKTITSFTSNGLSESEIKKYLYNLGIPFRNWVFIAEQPSLGFMLTWKMVIKYCSGLFFDDYQQIWDQTLNWKLEFNHGKFTYGKDLIFNANNEADKIVKSVSEMTARKFI